MNLSVNGRFGRSTWTCIAVLLAALPMIAAPSLALAQGGGAGNGGFGGVGFVNGAVGGVSIDANGVLADPTLDEVGELRKLRSAAIADMPAELNDPSPLRKISLRRLEAAIQSHLEAKTPIPNEMRVLAGLQRVQYVFVYPELNDIVLAGPADGWIADARGDLVGRNESGAVLHCDDLLVALRSAEGAARTGISCSIDPTNEGVQRFRKVISRTREIGPNPQRTIAQLADAMGPQTVRVTGVPATSHFARVLVAADYRMKRLAMNLDRSPVKGLPSFMELAKAGRGPTNMMPRWWLTPEYEPLVKDKEGLAWELPEPAVVTMTEDDFVAADGSRRQSGTANATSRRWAVKMTERYGDLAEALPIFSQLRNCMDLSVVAALLVKEDLPRKAGFSMPLLMNEAQLPAHQFFAPKQIDAKASFLKKGRNWLISVSGGVQINPWQIASNATVDDKVAVTRSEAAYDSDDRWWWD